MEKTIRRVMYDKSYTYTYRTGMSEGPILGNHMHIYYEFLQLIEGNALYNVEGTEYEISSGDLLITNPNEFHFITFPKKAFIIVSLQIHSSFVSSMNCKYFRHFKCPKIRNKQQNTSRNIQ